MENFCQAVFPETGALILARCLAARCPAALAGAIASLPPLADPDADRRRSLALGLFVSLVCPSCPSPVAAFQAEKGAWKAKWKPARESSRIVRGLRPAIDEEGHRVVTGNFYPYSFNEDRPALPPCDYCGKTHYVPCGAGGSLEPYEHGHVHQIRPTSDRSDWFYFGYTGDSSCYERFLSELEQTWAAIAGAM